MVLGCDCINLCYHAYTGRTRNTWIRMLCPLSVHTGMSAPCNFEHSQLWGAQRAMAPCCPPRALFCGSFLLSTQRRWPHWPWDMEYCCHLVVTVGHCPEPESPLERAGMRWGEGFTKCLP